MMHRWNVAVGNFFFRYRNTMFPVLFALGVLIIRPRVMFGSPSFDRILMACGMVVALSGELVRLVTIGFEYIERGGKDGKVYASHLVQGGVYALTRNPMYLGNALIAIGMSMVLGSPVAYLLVIPFFLFVYQAIVTAEEAYLRNRFGEEYMQYCARVNRFLPRLREVPRALFGKRYDWRSAIRQDLSTMAALFSGFITLPAWRLYWLYGWDAAKMAAPKALAALLGVGMLYGFLAYLKKRRLLFY